ASLQARAKSADPKQTRTDKEQRKIERIHIKEEQERRTAARHAAVNGFAALLLDRPEEHEIQRCIGYLKDIDPDFLANTGLGSALEARDSGAVERNDDDATRWMSAA